MKLIIAAFVVFFSSSSFALSMKIEGNCAGKLADGTSVAFQYYSNFNGCKNTASAAITYEQGYDGMTTGKRSLTDNADTYTFGKTKVVFANSTGNTSGKFRYTDKRGDRRSVTLQCDVRDYEYGECN